MLCSWWICSFFVSMRVYAPMPLGRTEPEVTPPSRLERPVPPHEDIVNSVLMRPWTSSVRYLKPAKRTQV